METSLVTTVTFVLYIAGVFVLAAISHKLLSKKSFMGEYFLGSRGLGSWALAFTFAATSSSGGSFTGYPSLIYSYGWVLALWIASYMIMPACTMGVMGKRLNQVARKSGAITIPDVLRDRFESTGLALFATCTIIFFTICNLIAQFKAGALIIEETFNLPADWGYGAGLVIFAVTVVFYTAYGGFRAVVWTDVMQGIVMGIGVVILVFVVLSQVDGGLDAVNRKLLTQDPKLITSVNGAYNDLTLNAVGENKPGGLIYRHPKASNAALELRYPSTEPDTEGFVEVVLATDSDQEVTTTGNDVKRAIEEHAVLGELLTVAFPYRNDEGATADGPGKGATGVIGVADTKKYVFIRGDEAVFGPGRRNDGTPFHPLGMVISFFFMWAITGMGQPGTMVRLMAFRESRTLKRAMLTVTIYYALIYLPMVFIFVGARALIPELSQENSDKAMVLVSTQVVANLGFGYQILGAIFIAAPFAAVMSTVDSFLLMISSGLVRDVYQRTINPNVSDRTVKIASYATTVVVGVFVTVLALKPPDFLQRIIVFTGGGFAATFLCPIFFGIYWKGMTRQGALASMIGGFTVIVALFAPPFFGYPSKIDLFGFHPILVALLSSLMLAVVVSKLTGPSPEHLVEKYFYRKKEG